MADASATSSHMIRFMVNGNEVQIDASEPDVMLLDILRDRLGITSPKNGCQPQAQCGCCTVLIDDRPMLACTMKPTRLQGKHVLTLEGLDENERDLLAACFVSEGGLQCGFCTPGIALRAYGLCSKNPNPSHRDILKALEPHLCRCTGYKQIVQSIERYAPLRREQLTVKFPPVDVTGQIGSSLPRYQGTSVVLGEKPFVDDLRITGMKFGALRFSDHPRATVKQINVDRAVRSEGVHGVFTAADVPGDRIVGLISSDWPIFIKEGEETRYIGDVIAAVVADSQILARKAAALINIEYEVHLPVTSTTDAMQSDAPLIHPAHGSNVLSKSTLKRGSIQDGFDQCAHVLEDVYQTQHVEHLYLEPESCVAVPIEADSQTALHIYSQGQGVFDDRRQIASVLAIDEEQITVELVSNGGAFGGKEDLSIQAHTALLAWLTKYPVKLTLTRQESIRLHPKRHPIQMAYKIGCDAEGHLLAIQARFVGDTGAYASVGAKVLERAGGHCAGPYRVPNIDMEALAVYTNNPPCGAMRGFGVNQAAFALESLLDRLAEKVGIDGYDIRERNILEPGDTFASGQVMDKPFGLRQTLEAVKDQYKSNPNAGIACGIKNVGIGNGMPDIGRCALTVNSADSITIRVGFTEMGQGLFTICIQFAVEATGLSPDLFSVTTDTTLALDCGQTTASRATVLAGNAVLSAAQSLKNKLDQGTLLDQLAGQTFPGEWQYTETSPLGKHMDKPGGPKTHLTYGFATQVALLDDQGRLTKLIAAHDVGKVINPTQLKGQIYGALHMGIGYALTEELVIRDGFIQAERINDCGVLRAHQMPEMEAIFIEVEDPDCPRGARGVGEIGLVPTAPAIANALFAYDGKVRRTLPLKDSPAALAITNMKP